MRVLLDTNIFVYMSIDSEYLSRDVLSLLKEPDTLLYISTESVRELIVGYRNKGLCSKCWKTVEEMVAAIENEFYVQILPVKNTWQPTPAWKSTRRKDIKTLLTMSSSPMPLQNTCRLYQATPASGSIATKGLT